MPSVLDCRKTLRGFSTKGLQPAACTRCALITHNLHTSSLRSIFRQVHAPTENDQTLFAACGRQTLRGFFDTLSRRQRDLHKKVKRQGQKGGVFILLPVAGHEQQKQNDEQVAGVEVRGEQISEKRADIPILPAGGRTMPRMPSWLRLWGRGRHAIPRRLTRSRPLGRRLGGPLLLRPLRRRGRGSGRIGNPIAAIGAVGLRDVPVIHGRFTCLN